MDKLISLRGEIDRIDEALCRLFEQRMAASAEIAAWKREHCVPIRDAKRESELLARNLERISDPDLRPHYKTFQQSLMACSRAYQAELIGQDPAALMTVSTSQGSYPVYLRRGALSEAADLLDLHRRVFLVTDDGIPPAYSRMLAAQCGELISCVIPQGEASKTLAQLHTLLQQMLDAGLTRCDCVLALGGGVIGDLAGLAAALYMRGIDFYNVPTTLLAMLDSSIGGKTAVDLDGIKNIVGAFYQPRRVLVDPRTLSTLPRRQIANGLAEAVKMALCFDAEGFARFEAMDPEREITALKSGEPVPGLERIIADALKTKKRVVELDEKEQGLRRVLNFGHTLGHGLESLHEENGLLHGECVALGMLPLCSPAVRERLLPVLEKLGLPVTCSADPDRVMQAVVHDKKMYAGKIHTIFVETVGSFTEKDLTPDELKSLYLQYFTRPVHI